MAATSRLAELARPISVVRADVLEWRSSQAVPQPEQVEDVEIHLLSREHPEWGDVLRNRFAKAAPSLIARGDQCYLCTVDGRFAGWIWLSRASFQRDPWLGLRFRIAPDEAQAHSMWVEPDYRQLGIGGMLMSRLLSDVQRQPAISRVYGWVDRENREMQLLVRMVFGFTEVQRVTGSRLLHLVGWQLPWSDNPRFGPVSRVGRHSGGL